MIRASSVTLISTNPDAHGVYDAPATIGREVACDVRSVTKAEYYEALSQDLHPSWTLILSDYTEYQDELTCVFEGHPYKIIRTQVWNDNRIELVIERVVAHDI